MGGNCLFYLETDSLYIFHCKHTQKEIETGYRTLIFFGSVQNVPVTPSCGQVLKMIMKCFVRFLDCSKLRKRESTRHPSSVLKIFRIIQVCIYYENCIGIEITAR